MALLDIVFPDGDPQNISQTVSRGNSGVISDIQTEGDSNPGMLVTEVPVVEDTTADIAFTWVG